MCEVVLKHYRNTAKINPAPKAKLDVFQLKGLRKILNIKATFIDRTNTNEFVYNKANEEINKPTTPTADNPNSATLKVNLIVEFSDCYESRKLTSSLDIIKNRNNDKDPRFQLTAQDDLKLNQYQKRRSGHPRNVWWHFAIQGIWTWIGKLPIDPTLPRHNRYTNFNPDSTIHQDEIKEHADIWTKTQTLSYFFDNLNT